MSKTFNSLKSLFAHVEKQVKEALLDEVASAVKFEEQRQIEDVVYGAYPEPYEYVRRRYDNGGLQDIEMMVSELEVRGNHMVLSVVNTAKGQDQEDLYLAPLVEYGHNTGHGKYQYPYNQDHTAWKFLQSRPFTQSTIDALSRSGAHIKAFKHGMKSRGIVVK